MNNQLSYEEQLSCYLKAYNSLDEEDKYCIDRCYDQLLGIRNMGELSAWELLYKLGIFLTKNKNFM